MDASARPAWSAAAAGAPDVSSSSEASSVPDRSADPVEDLHAVLLQPVEDPGPSRVDTPVHVNGGNGGLPIAPAAVLPHTADTTPSSRSGDPYAQPAVHPPVRMESVGAVDGHVPEGSGCTAAQMRRFIKSRPWVPMHELRRRFAIDGGDDDVTLVDVERQRLFVGLPQREGRLLGDLLRAGDVGFELATDPGCPIVIGVFPMRPVPRA